MICLRMFSPSPARAPKLFAERFEDRPAYVFKSLERLSSPARYIPAENAAPIAMATIQNNRWPTLISFRGLLLVAKGG
ncbi:MAG: hypothetical protein V4491_07100, partial [Pseudomonadota bacterium]